MLPAEGMWKTAEDGLFALADRGYYKGYEILACERAGDRKDMLDARGTLDFRPLMT